VGVPTIIVASNIDDVPFDSNIEDASSFYNGRMGWDDKLRGDWPHDSGSPSEEIVKTT